MRAGVDRLQARALLARALGLAAAAAASATLLACGGSNAPARAPAAEQRAERKAETDFEDFARCLREHGVEAEAQSRPGGGHGLKIAGGEPAQMQAAEKACARFRPPEQNGPSRFSPQERVELEEKLQRFAKCMRAHGIEVEASAAGGRPQINIHGTAPKPASPAFQAAQKACQGLLPGGGPPNAPAPGAGGS